MDQRIESFLGDVLALAGEEPGFLIWVFVESSG